ncbi:hypothetical protein [Pseudomonas oryzihabitans]|uniref:Uncharacterized protein n=1 Tax=Pseudomonas oryzihabitans TaxID=47885 RepID=A0A1G5MV25_9PSED|nr:hypothetical protein [Pseudomonas psychrotolerans]NMY89804.1 hypothetical protein [Pseudomonas psychrotolerans]SCZ28694.1 hypothetical protein SAMN05216279_103101 [Pseudomonas psychrotolerans]
MMFTEQEVLEERRLAYDQGFCRGSGMHPDVPRTEGYLNLREQDLAKPVKRERRAPRPRAAGEVSE